MTKDTIILEKTKTKLSYILSFDLYRTFIRLKNHCVSKVLKV